MLGLWEGFPSLESQNVADWKEMSGYQVEAGVTGDMWGRKFARVNRDT